MVTLIALVVDFVPYIGMGVLFIPWIIYTFLIDNYVLTIQLTVLYMILIIIRQIMEPKILATNIGLHPLIALIILFISFQHLGLLGVVLTPIALIMISAIYHAGIFHYLWHFIKHG